MTGSSTHEDARDGRLQIWGRFVSGLLALLGILGLLRVGFTGPADTVAVFVVHPVSAMIYLVAGLIGIALVARAPGRRIFAVFGGAGLALWGLLSLALQGSPTEVFSADQETVALHLVLGLAGLALALTPAGSALTPDEGA